jgi:hypothetical protein
MSHILPPVTTGEAASQRKTIPANPKEMLLQQSGPLISCASSEVSFLVKGSWCTHPTEINFSRPFDFRVHPVPFQRSGFLVLRSLFEKC